MWDEPKRGVEVPRFSRTKAMDDAAAADPLAEVALPMLDAVAINVMYADADLVIRYVNPASLVALRKLEKFLPVSTRSIDLAEFVVPPRELADVAWLRARRAVLTSGSRRRWRR